MNEETEANVPIDDESIGDVLARVTDAVFALDEEWRFTFLNEQAEHVLQRKSEELLGTVVWDEFPEAVGSTFQREYERAMETQEPVAFEEFYPPLDTWLEVRAYPSETGLSVYFCDITERVSQQHEIREREHALRRAYEVISDSDRSFSGQIDALLRIVRETVGTDYATLSKVDGDEYVFQAVDAPDDADLRAGERVPLEVTNCERVVATERTLVLDDVERDAPELADRAGNAEWGISCYLGAPVFVGGEVHGTFCFYDMEARSTEFSDWEVTFVDLLSNWTGYELERQRHVDQLAALNELNGVVREITDAVIDQSTREEIEAIVCQGLADADSYLFAWIGSADRSHGRITPRTESGVEGYLDDVDIDLGDRETTRSPAGEAVRTGTMQVARNLRENPDYRPWHDQAEEYDFRSWAAIPITCEGTHYGVLNVHSARPDAFDEQEQAVIGQLGELLGHAITASQRKEALMSDEVVELEFEIRDTFETAEGSSDGSETIEFDRTIPLGNENYLTYGLTDEDGIAKLRAIADERSSWESLEVLGERDDEAQFEARLSEPPIVSAVASQGGRVQSARIEGGNYRTTVHLPRGADVHALVDGVRELYPNAEVIAQRQSTKREGSGGRIYPAALGDLTERQRATVESAFYAGFFEWPRTRTGEDVADSLGISPSTFHQHLRTGEQKILRALLDRDE